MNNHAGSCNEPLGTTNNIQHLWILIRYFSSGFQCASFDTSLYLNKYFLNFITGDNLEVGLFEKYTTKKKGNSLEIPWPMAFKCLSNGIKKKKNVALYGTYVS